MTKISDHGWVLYANRSSIQAAQVGEFSSILGLSITLLTGEDSYGWCPAYFSSASGERGLFWNRFRLEKGETPPSRWNEQLVPYDLAKQILAYFAAVASWPPHENVQQILLEAMEAVARP